MENTEENKNSGMESKDIPQTPPVQQLPEFLTQQQALQVLIDAAKVAQSRGIFTLDDAELVNKAIRAFLPKGPVPSTSV